MTESPQEKKKRKPKRRGRGEGTVYQRSDGRWAAEITLEDGKRKTLYAGTQEGVIQKLQQAQYEKKQGTLATGPKQKLGDHLSWWFEQVHKRNLRVTTCSGYRSILDSHILPALGRIQLQRLTTRDIQSFYNRKLDEGYSSSYVHSMQKIIHKSLDYAVKSRLIPYNPSSGVSLPPQRAKKGQALTLEQARHLLKALKGHKLETLIGLALVTGMRHGEMLALHWEDIDFEQGSINVHRNLINVAGTTAGFEEGPTKTETSQRIVPISPTICEMLKAHRIRQNEERLKAGALWKNYGLVFCNVHGGFLYEKSIRTSFYRLLDQAGLPRVRIHDLRHTTSTLLQSMGVNPKTVQDMLGHRHFAITADVYTHPNEMMRKAMVDQMENFFPR